MKMGSDPLFISDSNKVGRLSWVDIVVYNNLHHSFHTSYTHHYSFFSLLLFLHPTILYSLDENNWSVSNVIYKSLSFPSSI